MKYSDFVNSNQSNTIKGSSKYKYTLMLKFRRKKRLFIIYKGVGTEEKRFLAQNKTLANLEVVLQCMGTILIYQKVSFTKPISLQYQDMKLLYHLIKKEYHLYHSFSNIIASPISL